MDSMRLEKQMQFLLEIDKLKSILRQNYLADGSRRENDTEHSWHLAMMVMVLSEYFTGLDTLKTIKMTLIHDIVEIDAGDTFAYDEIGYLDKEQREKLAAERIFGILPSDQAEEMYSLWSEYEEMKSDEALCASIADRLQPLTLNISTGGAMWRAHGVTMQDVLKRNKVTLDRAPEAIAEYVKNLISDAQQKGFFTNR